MPTRKHYFVEQRADGRYAVRGKGSKRASAILATQREAIARVDALNSADHPGRGAGRNTKVGHRDKWRAK